VDVGTNKVCSILARVGSEGELKILGTGIAPCYGVQKGRVESIEEVKSAVMASFEELQRYVGRGVISSVYASISGNHISCMNTKDTLRNAEYSDGLTSDHLQALMKASLPAIDSSKQILHVIPTGAEVD
jgi:cell division protein FtsA